MNTFFFKWVAVNTPFDPIAHAVEDEKIVSAVIEHSEGDIPTLTITIKNPRAGLLALTRKQWAWLSWFNGTTAVPLFHGRIVGIPENMHKEDITLIFHARSPTFSQDKIAVADTLKVSPYYDPIWIDEKSRDDPDTVLEARTQLWHIDRVTQQVTVSDILVGEDGNEDFQENEVPYDSVEMRLNQTPLRSLTVDATAQWGQIAAGNMTLIEGAVISTYTGDGLISDWPKTGSRVDGGWEVAFGQAIDVLGIGDMPDTKFTDPVMPPLGANYLWFETQPIPEGWVFIKTLDFSFLLTRAIRGIVCPLWIIKADLQLTYNAKRDRTERLQFRLDANVQPISTEPDEAESQPLTISSVDLTLPIGAEIPIGDPSRAAFFTTPRGQQALEYLICLARAQLLLRSRCVEISWQCRFERAINLSLRKNARIFDRRIPGGTALGKIIAYSITMDGDSGVILGNVTIGCPVGYGQSVEPIPGDPLWVQEGWVEAGWQQYTNKVNVLPAADVGYTVPTVTPNDDGLILTQPLHVQDVVSYFEVHNPWEEQKSWLETAAGSPDEDAAQKKVEDILKAHPTQYEYHLKPVEGGPFETIYPLTLTMLEVPQGIDLSADMIDAVLEIHDKPDTASFEGST